MGISRGAANLFAETWRDCQLKGRLLQLGKQGIDLRRNQLIDIQKRFQFSNPSELGTHPYSDIDFFKLFNFDTIDSMDTSDYEGATIVHDLNVPVPDSLKGKFDVIFDSGTMEHIFNVPQV